MINDPRSVRISNEVIRPVADQLAQLYFKALAIQSQMQAEGWIKFFPDDQNEVLEDGADKDGRPIISGHDVQEILTILDAFITDMETGKTQSVLKVAVNPQR